MVRRPTVSEITVLISTLKKKGKYLMFVSKNPDYLTKAPNPNPSCPGEGNTPKYEIAL